MNQPADADDAHATMARTMKLLWESRERPPSKRGPKPRLDLDRIVAAAIDLAGTDGLAGVSMQRVAERLDVAVGSLYTYVPAKPALLAVMLDTAVGWSSLPHELPGGWRERIETWAREDWRIYQDHPWLIDLAAMAPSVPGPHMLDWMESALRVLEPTGLTIRQRMGVVNAVDVFVRGAAREAISAATRTSPEATRARDDGIDLAALARRYPNINQVVATDPALFVITDPEFGLQRLLDGIELFIEARAD